MKRLLLIGMLGLGFAATATTGTASVAPATTVACTMTAYVAYYSGNTLYFATSALRNSYVTSHFGATNGGVAYNVPCNRVFQEPVGPVDPGTGN
ncbi:hypothetical protein [Pedobacter caeni]|uniref:Uncharacterized protein n=1 Tax=Pedobacter caeni TaxID=288992 RepID=A0A1M5AC28_9SPHI|nr:hypothetical protein [Pedobacter caeni]SHF27848.1 hypothetical protein SAMN04488522_102682 [Pedobacter caeni]